jgi:hypothetical protein
MDKLKVTLTVDLNTDVIEECIAKGYSNQFLLDSIKAHIESAIGNGKILGSEKVIEARVETIEVCDG